MTRRPAGQAAEPSAAPSAATSELPRFNWGAFLVPPIWGVAHGQWAGVFFLPVWAFVDNVVRGDAASGGWATALGAAMAVTTLGLQVFFACKANEVARHRAGERFAPEAYLRRQRYWAIAGVAIVLGMALWISAYFARYGTALAR